MVSINKIQTIVDNAKEISVSARQIKSDPGNENLDWNEAVRQAIEIKING